MKALRVLVFAVLLSVFLVPSVLAEGPVGSVPADSSAVVQPLADTSVVSKPTVVGAFNADPLHRGVESIGTDGRDGTVWVSSESTKTAREYWMSGQFTGRERSSYYADMAYDYSHNLMYQMQVNKKYVIRTWNPRTGLPGETITDPDGVWNQVPHPAVAYNPPLADLIYIAGSTDNKIYQVRGLFPHSGIVDPGRVIKSWDWTQPGTIEGMAWLPNNQLAITTSNPGLIYVVNESTMAVEYKYSLPGGGSLAGGIDAQKNGTAWVINRSNGMAYHINLTVALQNPAMGEVVQAGTPYTLTWRANRAADHFKVKFSADGGATWTVLNPNVATDTFSWTPTVQKTHDNCRIKVVAFDADNNRLGANKSFPFTVMVAIP